MRTANFAARAAVPARDAQLREEVEWLGQTEQLLDVAGADYLGKRLSSDRGRKSSRLQVA
ncbi:MAG TPA: hypothetical protein DCQ04_02655 [Actinobacteria bacterium]|nr:hypothetical protein [Actinomycetota bacterium]